MDFHCKSTASCQHGASSHWVHCCGEQNREVNAQFTNIEWEAADATALELKAGDYDVVFSNWLLMYLGNEEVAKLAADSLAWVKSPAHGPPLIDALIPRLLAFDCTCQILACNEPAQHSANVSVCHDTSDSSSSLNFAAKVVWKICALFPSTSCGFGLSSCFTLHIVSRMMTMCHQERIKEASALHKIGRVLPLKL